MTVLVYLPYYHGPPRYHSSSVWHFLEAPLRCHFCLVVFNFLSHDFTLILISLSLYASINCITPQPRFISLTTQSCTLIITTTDTPSLKAPVATAFIIKYILFFTLSYTFTSILFFYLCADDLVKSPASLRIFFGPSSLSEHTIALFFSEHPHQYLFVCIHFLFFPVARICYWYSRVA